MKTYQAVFDENKTDGVFGISLVHDPAMEGTFVALNKQEIKLKEVDLEQRILLGLVLEPNKPVYRNQNGEEFNIVFNEQTIKDLSYNFFKSNYHKNSTIEHEQSEKIEGVTFVESWIVEDPKVDKSSLYGFSYPKGSWLATMKVDSDDVWNNYVKTGKVQGFSIDAMLSLKEVNLKSEINMSKLEDAMTGILTLLKSVSLKPKEAETKADPEVELKFGMVKSADGQITFEYEGEELVAGVAIWVNADDGTKVPVPAADYPLEDGRVLSIQEDGIVATVGEPAQEEAPAEMEAEPSAPSATPAPTDIVNQMEDKIKSIMIKYEEQEKVIESMKQEIVELKSEPVTKSKKSAPVQVELDKVGY